MVIALLGPKIVTISVTIFLDHLLCMFWYKHTLIVTHTHTHTHARTHAHTHTHTHTHKHTHSNRQSFINVTVLTFLIADLS